VRISSIGESRRAGSARSASAKATEAAKLPGFKFRNLRHSGATWALEAGANPVLVAFRLGTREHPDDRDAPQRPGGVGGRRDR
jgi:integrase